MSIWPVVQIRLAHLVTVSAIVLVNAAGIYVAIDLFRPSTVPFSVVDKLRRGGLESCEAFWLPELRQRACMEEEVVRVASNKGPASLVSLDKVALKSPLVGDRCHVWMHRAAAAWVRRRDMKVGALQSQLPTSRSVNCAAGFTHGMMAALLPATTSNEDIASMATVCESYDDGLLRKNCIHGIGHAFTERSRSRVATAIAACRALGDQALDCIPGVFHASLFDARHRARVTGGTGHARAKALASWCSSFDASGGATAEACWLRGISALEGDRLPSSVDDMEALCGEVVRQQHAACLAGSVWQVATGRSPDTFLKSCAQRFGRHASGCFRGLNLLGRTPTQVSRAVGACVAFSEADACARRLAHVAAVVLGRPNAGVCPSSTVQQACRSGLADHMTPTGLF